mmetsp:Transcript_36399/g.87529  ORF Transcript_36399/g.87529 Transcript_36399/m.87529 type:complete len:290 (+) Transcript_36399:458-1327(+)
MDIRFVQQRSELQFGVEPKPHQPLLYVRPGIFGRIVNKYLGHHLHAALPEFPVRNHNRIQPSASQIPHHRQGGRQHSPRNWRRNRNLLLEQRLVDHVKLILTALHGGQPDDGTTALGEEIPCIGDVFRGVALSWTTGDAVGVHQNPHATNVLGLTKKNDVRNVVLEKLGPENLYRQALQICCHPNFLSALSQQADDTPRKNHLLVLLLRSGFKTHIANIHPNVNKSVIKGASSQVLVRQQGHRGFAALRLPLSAVQGEGVWAPHVHVEQRLSGLRKADAVLRGFGNLVP